MTFTTKLPLLLFCQFEQQLRVGISRAISEVAGALADGAGELGTFEAESDVSDDTVRSNKAVTRWVGAVGSVGRPKLGGLVGDSSEQIGADDGANRFQRDDLTTAARRIHGFISDRILEQGSQTIIAVSVTTGDWESV
jgi:hypothetical protein